MLSLLAVTTVAQAQNDGGQGDVTRSRQESGDLDRDRDRDQDRTKQYDKDQNQVRKNLHDNIDAAPGLTADERAAMNANLDACVELGIPASQLEAVFPDGDGKYQHKVSTQTMIKLQKRVMTMAREGMPVEPVLSKVQEGRTKGVAEPLLEQACVRMENNVRTANRIMTKAMNDGLEPPKDQAQQRRMNTEMAQQMWRGMNEEGYDQLRERARLRLRDGDCDTNDLVAAGEVATRLLESGVDPKRAMRFSGEALQQGYRAQEMKQIQVMIASQYRHGKSIDGFFGDMEHCMGAGMGAGEMHNYMMRHGWTGPGDMYGPGGYQPTDHKGHGGQSGGGDQGGGGGHGSGGGGNDG